MNRHLRGISTGKTGMAYLLDGSLVSVIQDKSSLKARSTKSRGLQDYIVSTNDK